MCVLCSGEEGEAEAAGDDTHITVVLTCECAVLGEEGEQEATGDHTRITVVLTCECAMFR